MTNFYVEGARAATQEIAYTSISDVKNTFTPPDLLNGVAACFAKNNYDDAIPLILLAMTYSHFDGQRVTDPTAKDAGMLSYIEMSSKFSANDQTFQSKLKEATKRVTENPKALTTLYNRFKEIGPPNYYPNGCDRHPDNFSPHQAAIPIGHSTF